ncbi:MAG: hypothetical protein ABW034_16815 [Steroidobacteraceae bacterium]
MNRSSKRLVITVALANLIIGEAQSALTTAAGVPINVFADPSDFVIELDTAGSCGSKYFHVQRASANFRELTAVALTAFSVGKRLTFFVASCSGDRNIVSHGYASRS